MFDGYVGTWTVDVEGKSGCWSTFALAFEITQEDVNNGLKSLDGDWWLVSNPGDRRQYSGQIADGGNFRFSFYTNYENLDVLGDFTGSDASSEGLDGDLANFNGCVAPAHATK